MLSCEGYKMFKGSAVITPKNKKFDPFLAHGTWLYKPDFDTWYVNGHSYPAEIVSQFSEDADK